MSDVLLMICEANVCRSPVVAVLGQRMFASCKVLSAGRRALPGLSAHTEVVRLMAARGLDLSQHRSQPLHPVLCDRASLIFVMDRLQQDNLRNRHPAMSDKIVRLGHFEGVDIPDPIGQAPAFFAEVVRQIEMGLQSWRAHLAPNPTDPLQST
ncbi:MAG: low molecular weight phosphotyrosine protein phosphatase [Alphaproteobacteria bacterium]|nr:low molecular weight phosphotyrosine protein phosphatase [Alphaproteobacteria bacterium]